MPTSSTMGGSLLPISNPKRATMIVVDNGFIIELAKTDNYGEVRKVAKDLAEAQEIVAAYFA